jgi:hypothetical protein
LHSAQMTYVTSVGAGEFAGTANSQDISGLTSLNTAGLIDGVMALGFKSGYGIVGDRTQSTPTTPATFYFSANPITASGIAQTGIRRVGIGSNGVIKGDATASDLATPFDATTLAASNPLAN